MSPETKPIERTISTSVLALLVVGCLVVLWPFVSALVWAIVLAIATWPVFRRLLAFTAGRRTSAALLMTLLAVMVFLLPFLIVGLTLADNVRDLSIEGQKWIDAGPPDPPAWLYKIPLGGAIAGYWHTIVGDSQSLLRALGKLIEPASSLLLAGGLSVGHSLIDLVVSIFVAFFLYRDGVGIAHRAVRVSRRISPLRGEYLLLLAGATVRSVVYGILGTALVQAVVAGIGYAIARVPGAALLALLTFFLAVTPIGAPLVYIPATLWLLHKGETGWAIFMISWGVFVSSIDNVLKPMLIRQGSDMPFLLVMFGVIGGALAFGFIGVFLGPTLLAVGYRLLQEWAGVPDESTITDELTPTAASGSISHPDQI